MHTCITKMALPGNDPWIPYRLRQQLQMYFTEYSYNISVGYDVFSCRSGRTLPWRSFLYGETWSITISCCSLATYIDFASILHLVAFSLRTICFIVRCAGLIWSQQRFWVVVICPIIKCLTVLEFSFILFDLCLFITIFNLILNYVPIVTFWIFTCHKIWFLLIIFCFIWNYWIIYFLTYLEVFWSVVS